MKQQKPGFLKEFLKLKLTSSNSITVMVASETSRLVFFISAVFEASLFSFFFGLVASHDLLLKNERRPGGLVEVGGRVCEVGGRG